MPDLIAQGEEPQQRWRRSLPVNQDIVLGRSGRGWAVPWDAQVSRHHARLRWNGHRLEVRRDPEARNPVYLRGQEVEQFDLQPGEHFVIGQTTFTLADQRVTLTTAAPQPVQQQSFSAQYLRQVPFRNPDRRIEVLSRLPEVISGAAGDHELFVRLVTMLLAGVPRAEAAAVVAVADTAGEAGEHFDETPPVHIFEGLPAEQTDKLLPESVEVFHWDQRLAIGADFQPSQSLIVDAVRSRQSVLHVWRGANSLQSSPFTQGDDYDWAFCTPVLGRACIGWGLYVAGRFSAERGTMPSSTDPTDLREDVKFTELVAAMLGALRRMRLLEHRQAALSQFFSPIVLETLAVEDPEVVLAPREAVVTVMFCDLQGFSRESERSADDLLSLLDRVSTALGVMTRHIRSAGGVVGDFQGDAAMGFWGWPFAQPDAAEKTCHAALAIRADLEALRGFRAGIGIATGNAVAGKLGTAEQVKVTVFGPVVNLASRLESMTRLLSATILLDETTADLIRREVPRTVARVRRLAKVRPFGLDTPLLVSELLPPESAYPQLTDEHLACYESALDAFLSGAWSRAFELLHAIPVGDRAKDFLTLQITRSNRTPPPGFDGVIGLESK